MANQVLESRTEVKNVPETTTQEPKRYQSWKKFWNGESGRQWPKSCQIYGCATSPYAGAHVNVRGFSRNVYIIPMCHEHNSFANVDWMPVVGNTMAVHAGCQDTRGCICYDDKC